MFQLSQFRFRVRSLWIRYHNHIGSIGGFVSCIQSQGVRIESLVNQGIAETILLGKHVITVVASVEDVSFSMTCYKTVKFRFCNQATKGCGNFLFTRVTVHVIKDTQEASFSFFIFNDTYETELFCR